MCQLSIVLGCGMQYVKELTEERCLQLARVNRAHLEGFGAGYEVHCQGVMQWGVLKAEHLPVGLREEEQQLAHEAQKGRAAHAEAPQDSWRGERCVRHLQRHHCDWRPALKHNLGCLRITLQRELSQVIQVMLGPQMVRRLPHVP